MSGVQEEVKWVLKMKNEFQQVGILILVVGVFVLALISINTLDWLARMPTATTLAGFGQSQIPLRKLYFVENEDNSFYLWMSTVRKLDVLASGPTVYVFDEYGRLLDWNIDSDRDHLSVQYYWRHRHIGVPVPLKQALQQVEQRTK